MEKSYRINKDVTLGLFAGIRNGGSEKNYIGLDTFASSSAIDPSNGTWLTLAEARKLRDRLTKLIETAKPQ